MPISEQDSNVEDNPNNSNILPPGDDESSALEDLNSDVSNTGPEVLWLVVLAILAGNFYVISKKSW